VSLSPQEGTFHEAPLPALCCLDRVLAGDPAGFVDHKEIAVFVNDRRGDAPELGRRRRTVVGRFGRTHGGYAHLVSVGNAHVGFGPLAVDPDLPGAQDPVDQALRHALELAEQEVVDALAVVGLVDPHQAHPGT